MPLQRIHAAQTQDIPRTAASAVGFCDTNVRIYDIFTLPPFAFANVMMS